MRQQGTRLGRGGLRRRVQPLPDLRVGQARAGMHHRRIELETLDCARGRHVHVADHAQPVDVGLERAHLVRQCLRQHRDHAPRKIHGRAALARIAVDGVAVADVVRYVGDRHDQPKVLALALAVNGVVEILGGFAVDGDQGQRSQVDAILAISRSDLGGQPLGLSLRVGGKLERQRVLAQRDLDFDAGIRGAAQDFLDACDRFAIGGRLFDDLGDHDLPGFGAAQVARRNEQVLVDTAVLGDDEPDAVLLVQAADDLAIDALEHLDDFSFRPAATVGAALAQRGAIAVQHLVHFARAQEVIVAAVIRYEKPEAIGMALHGAEDQVELGDDAQFALAIGEQLAVALHGGEAAVEGFARDRSDGEFAFQVGGGQRRPGVAQGGQDSLARRQQGRIDVARPGASGLAVRWRRGGKRLWLGVQHAIGGMRRRLLARTGLRAGCALGRFGELL